jgi:hypothetical protein
LVLCLALLAGVALSSCASIVSKSEWPVMIYSNPPGAAIKVIDEDGNIVDTGVTPLYVTLTSKDGFFTKADYDIEATLPGFPTANAHMSARLNPWYWGNLLFGGLIGFLIVDPATGAMWKLREEFNITLAAPSP